MALKYLNLALRRPQLVRHSNISKRLSEDQSWSDAQSTIRLGSQGPIPAHYKGFKPDHARCSWLIGQTLKQSEVRLIRKQRLTGTRVTYFKHPLLCMNSTAKGRSAMQERLKKGKPNWLSDDQMGMAWLSMGNRRVRHVRVSLSSSSRVINKCRGRLLGNLQAITIKVTAELDRYKVHRLTSFSHHQSQMALKYLKWALRRPQLVRHSNISKRLSEDQSWSDAQSTLRLGSQDQYQRTTRGSNLTTLGVAD